MFLLGDLNDNGPEYVKEFFKHARGLNRDIQMFFEFFCPPDNSFFDKAHEIFSNVCYEISPDSHDEGIRRKMGKTFSNEELVNSIKYALEKGAMRFDLYFMTGLPGQTKESIMETVDFCKEIGAPPRDFFSDLSKERSSWEVSTIFSSTNKPHAPQITSPRVSS